MDRLNTRSLDYAATLDQLLGLNFCKKKDAFERFVPHARPLTRHGSRPLDISFSESPLSHSFNLPNNEQSSANEKQKEDDGILELQNQIKNGLSIIKNNGKIPEENEKVEIDEDMEQIVKNGRKQSFSKDLLKAPSTELESTYLPSNSASSDDSDSLKENQNNYRNAGEIIKKSNSAKGSMEKKCIKREQTTAFEDWLSRKKTEERKKRIIIKENEKKEKERKEQRRKDAEKAFQSWKKNDERKQSERSEKLKQEMKIKETKRSEEETRKTEECKKAFETWKKAQNDKLKKISEMRIKKETERLCQEKERKVKEMDAQKAFQAWCEKEKKRRISMRLKERERKKNFEEQKQNEREYREALAKEAYEVWLQIKEKEREIANSFQERIVRFEKEVLKQKTIPWMPPSNVVPRKFTPSKPNNPPRRRTTANGNNSWLFGNRRSYSTNF